MTICTKADRDIAILIKTVTEKIADPSRQDLSDMRVGCPDIQSFVKARRSACRLPDHDADYCTAKNAVLGSPPMT